MYTETVQVSWVTVEIYDAALLKSVVHRERSTGPPLLKSGC